MLRKKKEKKLYENRCSEKTPKKNLMRTDAPKKKPSENGTNIQ
jgi:hypothetical protein